MSAPQPPTPATPPTSGDRLLVSRGEFLWISFAVWLGGIFILTLMPYLLIPRVGGPLAIALSYLLFFIAWQPIQSITQRTLGIKAAIIRMVIFVASAATLAAILRQSLPTLTS